MLILEVTGYIYTVPCILWYYYEYYQHAYTTTTMDTMDVLHAVAYTMKYYALCSTRCRVT